MPEPDDDASQPSPDPNQAAAERYREYRARQLRFDQEYLERLKRAESAAPPAPKALDPLWGHPICDECPKRVGCGLQQAMRNVDGFKAGGPR